MWGTFDNAKVNKSWKTRVRKKWPKEKGVIGAGDLAQRLECLLCKHMALSLSPRAKEKKKKKEKRSNSAFTIDVRV